MLGDRVIPPAKLLFRDAPFDQYLDGYDQSFDAILCDRNARGVARWCIDPVTGHHRSSREGRASAPVFAAPRSE